jgi:hypothetical protein
MKDSIFWGGALSGLALISFFFFANTFMVALGIALLGLAHALSVSNQAKLASQLQAVQQIGLGEGMGIYRQLERIGNILAPIITGLLITAVGYGNSLALIGSYTVISSLLFLLVSRRRSHIRIRLSDDEPIFCKIGEREVKLLDLGAGGLSFKDVGVPASDFYSVQFALPGLGLQVSGLIKVVNKDPLSVWHCRFTEIGPEAVEAIYQYLLLKKKEKKH